MPRAPNPLKGKAKKMWRKGKLAIEIAKELGIPEGTARRWKSEWERESERSKNLITDETSARKPRGAPKGNHNAKGNAGGGAPENNENNLKHGIYRRMLWRSQTKEMIEAMEDIPADEETLLKIQLQSLTIQEIDCLEAIEKYKSVPTGMMASRLIKTTEGDKTSVTTMADTTIDTILRLQRELTNIQRAKTKCIEVLSNIKSNRILKGITSDSGEGEAVTIYKLPSNGRDNG